MPTERKLGQFSSWLDRHADSWTADYRRRELQEREIGTLRHENRMLRSAIASLDSKAVEEFRNILSIFRHLRACPVTETLRPSAYLERAAVNPEFAAVVPIPAWRRLCYWIDTIVLCGEQTIRSLKIANGSNRKILRALEKEVKERDEKYRMIRERYNHLQRLHEACRQVRPDQRSHEPVRMPVRLPPRSFSNPSNSLARLHSARGKVKIRNDLDIFPIYDNEDFTVSAHPEVPETPQPVSILVPYPTQAKAEQDTPSTEVEIVKLERASARPGWARPKCNRTRRRWMAKPKLACSASRASHLGAVFLTERRREQLMLGFARIEARDKDWFIPFEAAHDAQLSVNRRAVLSLCAQESEMGFHLNLWPPGKFSMLLSLGSSAFMEGYARRQEAAMVVRRQRAERDVAPAPATATSTTLSEDESQAKDASKSAHEQAPNQDPALEGARLGEANATAQPQPTAGDSQVEDPSEGSSPNPSTSPADAGASNHGPSGNGESGNAEDDNGDDNDNDEDDIMDNGGKRVVSSAPTKVENATASASCQSPTSGPAPPTQAESSGSNLGTDFDGTHEDEKCNDNDVDMDDGSSWASKTSRTDIGNDFEAPGSLQPSDLGIPEANGVNEDDGIDGGVGVNNRGSGASQVSADVGHGLEVLDLILLSNLDIQGANGTNEADDGNGGGRGVEVIQTLPEVTTMSAQEPELSQNLQAQQPDDTRLSSQDQPPEGDAVPHARGFAPAVSVGGYDFAEAEASLKAEEKAKRKARLERKKARQRAEEKAMRKRWAEANRPKVAPSDQGHLEQPRSESPVLGSPSQPAEETPQFSERTSQEDCREPTSPTASQAFDVSETGAVNESLDADASPDYSACDDEIASRLDEDETGPEPLQPGHESPQPPAATSNEDLSSLPQDQDQEPADLDLSTSGLIDESSEADISLDNLGSDEEMTPMSEERADELQDVQFGQEESVPALQSLGATAPGSPSYGESAASQPQIPEPIDLSESKPLDQTTEVDTTSRHPTFTEDLTNMDEELAKQFGTTEDLDLFATEAVSQTSEPDPFDSLQWAEELARAGGQLEEMFQGELIFRGQEQSQLDSQSFVFAAPSTAPSYPEAAPSSRQAPTTATTPATPPVLFSGQEESQMDSQPFGFAASSAPSYLPDVPYEALIDVFTTRTSRTASTLLIGNPSPADPDAASSDETQNGEEEEISEEE
jgi:hypothetical protein